MELINGIVEAYVKQFSSPVDVLLTENEAFTLSTHEHAHMHSGSFQGKLLELISKMIKPSRVLEIGTFTGFSAICLSKGLTEEGVLHTIEIREEDAAMASSFFKKAGIEQKIKLHIGNAMEIIPTLKESWDLIFIDADKVNYIEYYELTLPMLKPGGWMLADNVLFHGQVLESSIKGKSAKAIHAFNQHVASDHRVELVMLTVRDGLSLIRKL